PHYAATVGEVDEAREAAERETAIWQAEVRRAGDLHGIAVETAVRGAPGADARRLRPRRKLRPAGRRALGPLRRLGAVPGNDHRQGDQPRALLGAGRALIRATACGADM